MRQGIDRKGRHLYPAFPYDHFTNSTDADIQAIYAFLMSSPAVNNAVPKTALPFPLNIRMLVAGWNFLFLQKGELIPDRAQTADWNRGRYLADGLGHCGACHTPRNLLGAEKKGESYAGAFAEGWFAPALNGTARVPHGWTADQLTEYLSTGWHPVHGAAAGPMAEVVKNLQMVPAADVRAIAVYIASLSVKAGNANAPTRERVPSNASPEIVAIFKGSCAQCHSEASIGPSKAVPLSMSATLRQESSANTVRVIREGIDAYRRTGGPYMPGFGTMLTDSQIAGLADYVRSRFTDLAQWGDIQSEILKAKEAPAQ
jgi:mono/diheme cytochrome c family protein